MPYISLPMQYRLPGCPELIATRRPPDLDVGAWHPPGPFVRFTGFEAGREECDFVLLAPEQVAGGAAKCGLRSQARTRTYARLVSRPAR